MSPFLGGDALYPAMIYKLHANPAVEEELDWFFCQAESDMGVSSNFLPLAQMAMSGVIGSSHGSADTMAESRIAAAHAEGQIRRWLEKVPRNLLAVLHTAYEPRGWPREVVKRFGRLAGLAVRTSAARKAYAKAGKRSSIVAWLATAVVRGEEATLTLVQAEAQRTLAPALAGYAAVRGTGKSVVPTGGTYAWTL